MGSEFSEEFLVQVGVYQEFVFLPLRFAIAVDVILENAIKGLMNKILHADNLVLMSESTEKWKNKLLKCKEAFKSKELKVNLKKTKVMVSGSRGKVLQSKCAKCSKRVMVNSVMCTKCSKCVHGRCAKMKRVASTLA